MQSVRATLNCVGVNTTNDISILGHMFGFIRRRVPTDPDSSVTAEVSMLDYVQRVANDYTNLNVIRVGFDALSTQAEADGLHKIDYCIYRIRNIYRPVGVSVGRVLHYVLSAADANGGDDIGSENEADELSDDWSAPTSGIDCFMVRNISDPDFVGISPRPGSCDKPSKRDGLIAGEIERAAADDLDFELVARTFAHEVGHFLGLPHNHDDGDCPGSAAGRRNLMAQTGCVTNNGVAANIRAAVQLSNNQGNTMDDHCSIRSGC